jgi:hypothetical protein
MEFFTLTFIIILLCGVWAKVGRMNGGGKPELPFGLDAHLFSLPAGFVGGLLGKYFLFNWYIIIPFTNIILSSAMICFAIAYAVTFLGRRIGIGQYFDLGTTIRKVYESEKIDFLLKPFFGVDRGTKTKGKTGGFWRDFVGLSLTGTVASLGLVILLLASGFHFLAFWTFFWCSFRGCAYAIAKHDTVENSFEWKIPHTVRAEYLSGFTYGLAFFVPLLYIILYI